MKLRNLLLAATIIANPALAQNASNPTVQSVTITQAPTATASAVRLGDLQAAIAGLAAVARTGSYADLLNKPIIPKAGAGLLAAADGTLSVDSQAPTAASTVPSLAGLRVLLPDGTYLTGTQLQGLLGGGGSTGGTTNTTASYATAFTSALSAASGAVGSAVTLTLTPGFGGWPAVAVTPSSTLAGTFSPTSTTPTASSTTALSFAFTPSTAGSGTLTAAASGMTAGTAASYTANDVMSQTASVPYTIRNAGAADSPVATTYNLGGGAYTQVGGYVIITAGSAAVPSSTRFTLGTSSTVAPTYGQPYYLDTNDYSTDAANTNSTDHPGTWSMGHFYIQSRTGTGTGSTATVYLWSLPQDGGSPVVMTNADGTPTVISITY